jgi:hypothetical protein
MSRVQRVTAERVLVYADALDGRHLIDVAVGPSFDPVLLSLDGEPDYRRAKSGASFPKQRAERPNAFRIHYRIRTRRASLDLPSTEENYHSVQPLPKGRWLLVRGRANDEKDKNAHVYDADGKLLRSFHAGDGKEDVQTTEKGRIWVGYFGEGVFGNTRSARRASPAWTHMACPCSASPTSGPVALSRAWPTATPSTSFGRQLRPQGSVVPCPARYVAVPEAHAGR